MEELQVGIELSLAVLAALPYLPADKGWTTI